VNHYLIPETIYIAGMPLWLFGAPIVSWRYMRHTDPTSYDNHDYDNRDRPHGTDWFIGIMFPLWPAALALIPLLVSIGNLAYRVSERRRKRWEGERR